MALACGLAALLLARRRLLAGLWLALGVAGVGLATLLALAAGATWGVGQIGGATDRSTDLVREAARGAFDITVSQLRVQSWALVAVGLALSAVAGAALLGSRLAATRRAA